jgi:hypothetical protein
VSAVVVERRRSERATDATDACCRARREMKVEMK